MNRKVRRTKPRCPLTKSVRFDNELSAKLALATIQHTGPKRGQPDMIRVYKCRPGGCGGYHITPQEQRNSHSG